MLVLMQQLALKTIVVSVAAMFATLTAAGVAAGAGVAGVAGVAGAGCWIGCPWKEQSGRLHRLLQEGQEEEGVG